jgi:hypothetical protein
VADAFNRDYPVGTRVYLRNDAGDEIMTRVQQQAEVGPDAIAVAKFEGFSRWHSFEGRIRLKTK